MRLVSKTREGVSPQGLARIYYTGHPADLDRYREEISSDILKLQNCAIYYDAEPEAAWDEEELLRELERMQLVVFPVTHRFFSEKNRALDTEFPFAIQRHIPVLPLQEEPGLSELFNKRCGDLQLLNPHDPDPTALPYEQKLEQFLSSVLIGDELAAKVRAAFDAYIFLSYRKKDRKYAQELIRLIHQNDFCRDIAIWYDEFLTPGEHFNDAIAEALEKSSLFALAVTPNIVEFNNYVMLHEYPSARRLQKPILPVEMVPTDKKILYLTFEELPPCANAYEEGALSGALLEAVQRLAIQENDDSPEHNFFIGLAYLNGIDMEVDRERALGLITGAAEAGLPEALSKLAEMYRQGEGVERNCRTAAAWQRKLADRMKAVYEESGSETDSVNWVNALWRLADYREDTTEGVAGWREAASACEELNERFGDWSTRSNLAYCYRRLATAIRNVDLSYGYDGECNKEEKEIRLKELELRRQLCHELWTREARTELAECCRRFGDRIIDRGPLPEYTWYEEDEPEYALEKEKYDREYEQSCEERKACYREGLTVYRQLFRDTGEDRYRRCVLYMEKELSVMEADPEERERARMAYLLFCRQWVRREDSAEARQELAGICEEEGDSCGEDRSRAIGFYTEALDQQLKLCEAGAPLHRLKDLAGKLEKVCRDAGMPERAEECARRVREAEDRWKTGRDRKAESLLHDGPEDLADRETLMKIFKEQSDEYSKEGDYDRALECCLKALEQWVLLVRETGTAESWEDICVFLYKINGLWEKTGVSGYDRVFRSSLEALGQWVRLFQETGDDSQWGEICNVLNRMGDLCEKAEDPMRAKKDYLAVLEPVWTRIGAAGRELMVRLCSELSWLLRETGDPARAKEVLLWAAGKMGDVASPLWIARLGMLEEEIITQERIMAEKGLSKWDYQYGTDAKDVRYYTMMDLEDTYDIYDSLASICRETGDLAGAKTYYQTMIGICERITDQVSSEPVLKMLAGLYSGMAETCEAEGLPDEAAEYKEKARRVSDEAE